MRSVEYYCYCASLGRGTVSRPSLGLNHGPAVSPNLPANKPVLRLVIAGALTITSQSSAVALNMQRTGKLCGVQVVLLARMVITALGITLREPSVGTLIDSIVMAFSC